MTYQTLKSPLGIQSLQLNNRIVMAPMSRFASTDGAPGADMLAYYQRRAQAGVGLIITDALFIDPTASYQVPNPPLFYGEKSLQGWQKAVEAVHQDGGKIMAQIMHAGSARQSGDVPEPTAEALAPSAVPHPYIKDAKPPKAMNIKDIEAVIQSFVTAAQHAKNLGFDGIEIHGAHGYLIDQFFWSASNQRNDQYGGRTLQARTRFACELIHAVRQAVGADYPISFRFSQWKMGAYDANIIHSPQELSSFLEPLTDAGVDIFHVSTRYFDQAAFATSPLSLASWTKKLSGKTTIAVGGVGYQNDFITNVLDNTQSIIDSSKLDLVEAQVANGEYDLIAIGRPLLADPQWWEKASQQNFQSIKVFTKDDLRTIY